MGSGEPEATFKYERNGVSHYLLNVGDTRLLLKHFTEKSGVRVSVLERRARDLAQAEATGLKEYAAEGLAPEIVWTGEMPPEVEGYGVVYRWVEGLRADTAYLTEAHVERLARALRQVHNHSANMKLVAPHPRDLAGWWNRVHEQYRDLPPEFIAALPDAVEEALVALVQSVSGDANAHIRFWQGASLVPVHGNVTMRNVIVQGKQLTLVDWSHFGLGDPAYELAVAVWELSLAGNEGLVEQLAGPYLRQAGDVMLERRVMIYRRLLPFGRFLDFVHRRWRGETLTPEQVKHSTRYLSAAMMVYGWSQRTIDKTLGQFASWLTSQQGK